MVAPRASGLLLTALSLSATVAAADPLKVEYSAETRAPVRPQVHLRVDSPVRNLIVKFLPGPAAEGETGAKTPETRDQTLRLGSLLPGVSHSVPLGTGKPGRTLWHAEARYAVDNKTYTTIFRFSTVVAPNHKMAYDYEHLNQLEHWLEVQFSGAALRGEVTVWSEDNQEIGAGKTDFFGPKAGRPGSWLRLPWTPKPGMESAKVQRLEVRVYDSSGFPFKMTLDAWSVDVPHREVLFATDRFDIEPPQQEKLDEAHQKILQVLEEAKTKGRLHPRLFITGHTDTVGEDAYNLELSRNRARAIAAYLQGKGVPVPVLFAGAGERAPRVVTRDNTDEPRNRRADYTIALAPPRLPPGISWLRLP